MPTINSKPNNQSEKRSNAFRRKCKELLKDGRSISSISKITGVSYKHTKNICEQINNET